MEKRPIFNNLDKLRFFAFLLVFVSHAVLFIFDAPRYLAQGDLGVSFFFVLSGFLITYLLSYEKEKRGSVQVVHFWGRRILRIWPVYFIVVAMCLFFSYIDPQGALFDFSVNASSIPWLFGFITNYHFIVIGGLTAPLSVLWSVSVEEQFYFVWPAIVSYVGKKSLPYIVLGVIVLSWAYRYIYSDSSTHILYATTSLMGDLVLGGIVGHFFYHSGRFRTYIAVLCSTRASVAIYSILAVLLSIKMFPHMFLGEYSLRLFTTFSSTVFSLVFICIILQQIQRRQSGALWASLGRVSYGLYAYHMICIGFSFLLCRSLGITNAYCIAIVALGSTIGVSYASFAYIEKKILTYKYLVS